MLMGGVQRIHGVPKNTLQADGHVPNKQKQSYDVQGASTGKSSAVRNRRKSFRLHGTMMIPQVPSELHNDACEHSSMLWLQADAEKANRHKPAAARHLWSSAHPVL